MSYPIDMSTSTVVQIHQNYVYSNLMVKRGNFHCNFPQPSFFFLSLNRCDFHPTNITECIKVLRFLQYTWRKALSTLISIYKLVDMHDWLVVM